MTKAEFLAVLGKAYNFPDDYSHNLDSVDEILANKLEGISEGSTLSLKPLFATLLAKERAGVLELLEAYFQLE